MASPAEDKDRDAVNRAFSRQSVSYDSEDGNNQVLQVMRNQVYRHVNQFLRKGETILELNAGTGIDALHFAQAGHPVLATDLSDGMVAQIQHKTSRARGLLSVKQLAYDHLNTLAERKFDYVFSNFGGLNCTRDLSVITRQLALILNKGGHVTWVIMPPVYVWEWAGVLKGRWRTAFRRFSKNGVTAHLEGEYFMTYYHSLKSIKRAFGPAFELIRAEGLCVVSPPPHRGDFPHKYPRWYSLLKQIDGWMKDSFPFNRTGDHIIVTFKLK